LLSVYELDGNEGINTETLGEILGRDWGWWRTVTGNLEVIASILEEDDETFAADLVMEQSMLRDPVEQIKIFRRFADETPKTRTWKLRSRLGERAIWYEEPEELSH
jgi:hypothetical protein